MRTNLPQYALLLFALLGITLLPSVGDGQDKASKTILSLLKVGEFVDVREHNGRYEITLLKGQQLKVTEIGTDYVTVEDAAGVTETTIPIYSIRSIVKIKTPMK